MVGTIVMLIIFLTIVGYAMYNEAKAIEWWYQEELRRHNEIVDVIKKGENDGEN